MTNFFEFKLLSSNYIVLKIYFIYFLLKVGFEVLFFELKKLFFEDAKFYTS